MRYHGLYYISNPGAQLAASLELVKAIVNGIESNYPRADRTGSWALTHRMMRDQPPPAYSDNEKADYQYSYQHFLHVSNISSDRTYNLIQRPSQVTQDGATSQDSAASQGVIAAIPLSQTDSHFNMVVNQMALLWTPQRQVEVMNGKTYKAGEFLIHVGELRSRRQVQASNISSPGVVVCISTFAGGPDDEDDGSHSTADEEVTDFEFAHLSIRELWDTVKKGIVFGRSDVREYMQMGKDFSSNQEQARQAVVRMWCEALGTRAVKSTLLVLPVLPKTASPVKVRSRHHSPSPCRATGPVGSVTNQSNNIGQTTTHADLLSESNPSPVAPLPHPVTAIQSMPKQFAELDLTHSTPNFEPNPSPSTPPLHPFNVTQSVSKDSPTQPDFLHPDSPLEFNPPPSDPLLLSATAPQPMTEDSLTQPGFNMRASSPSRSKYPNAGTMDHGLDFTTHPDIGTTDYGLNTTTFPDVDNRDDGSNVATPRDFDNMDHWFNIATYQDADIGEPGLPTNQPAPWSETPVTAALNDNPSWFTTSTDANVNGLGFPTNQSAPRIPEPAIPALDQTTSEMKPFMDADTSWSKFLLDYPSQLSSGPIAWDLNKNNSEITPPLDLTVQARTGQSNDVNQLPQEPLKCWPCLRWRRKCSQERPVCSRCLASRDPENCRYSPIRPKENGRYVYECTCGKKVLKGPNALIAHMKCCELASDELLEEFNMTRNDEKKKLTIGVGPSKEATSGHPPPKGTSCHICQFRWDVVCDSHPGKRKDCTPCIEAMLPCEPYDLSRPRPIGSKCQTCSSKSKPCDGLMPFGERPCHFCQRYSEPCLPVKSAIARFGLKVRNKSGLDKSNV